VGTTKNLPGPDCNPIYMMEGGSYLWVTNSDDDSLSVIATVARTGIDVIRLQGKPTGLAFGVGRIWVSVDLR